MIPNKSFKTYLHRFHIITIMASTSSDTIQSQSSTTPDASIDWASAFQCPEFLSSLQTALATINSAPHPDQLEQLGNSIPSQPTTSSASTQGNLSRAQGTFHAPSFVNTMSGRVQDTSSSLPQTQPSLSDSNLTIIQSFVLPTLPPNLPLIFVLKAPSAWGPVVPQFNQS